MNNVRTRMAPSPTGEFHIGGMRTLLYNWALAKQKKGQFVIRIEDTDRQRLVEGATERLLEVIKDYGFTWDEGPVVNGPHSPYVQSERLEIYKKHALALVNKGAAYYCFCTQERLNEMRDQQKLRGINSTKYDRFCLNLSKDEVNEKLSQGIAYVIRLKVPQNHEISWEDGVLGKISFNSNEIDDQILLKSDGYPTYHLGVVVDDHLMEISHVMRGNEWLPSTPKHILLYEAFGWEPPKHFHLPNLKELGGTKKLSKRHGPVSARGFLEDGYLAEALVNYLMFLGWNPGGEKEIYTLEEFVNEFDINKIHKADLVSFDRKKLEWFNGVYIRQKTDEELLELLKNTIPSNNYDSQKLMVAISLSKERMRKLSDFWSMVSFIFEPISEIDKSLLSINSKLHISSAIKVLETITVWTKEKLDEELMKCVSENKFKTGEFFMDLRISLSGNKITPPINESMILMDKEEVLNRLKRIY